MDESAAKLTGETADLAAKAAPTLKNPESQAFYMDSLRELSGSGIPFLLAGTFALSAYTGISRQTKDLDIFCKAGDFPRILARFKSLGCAIEVEDDGVGVEPGREVTEPVSGLVREGSGIGLRNVRERMQVLYGEDATVEMVSRPGRGTRVRLSMPVMDSPQRTSSPGTPVPHEREESRRARAAAAGR